MSVADDTSPCLESSADEAAEPEPPERLAVTVVEEGGDWSGFGPLEPAIQDAVAALARHPRLPLPEASEASIVLADDAMVRKLNLSYRSKDAPTNVLSFPFQPPPGAAGDAGTYLGDVVLAVETVVREAVERGIAPISHLQHLVVHGLLHLLDYDHRTDAEAEEMESVETAVLAEIGVADPHAAPASSS
jgi:probable rRNA maturation factor